jgi:hypothetical protein
MSISPGAPAIEPYLNPSSPDLPTFTKDDVRDFLVNRGFEQMQSLAPRSVVSVKFMSGVAARTLLLEDPTLAPDALVCVVEAHGRFQAGIVPGETPPSDGPHIFTVMYEVFDARTGNALLVYAPYSALEKGAAMISAHGNGGWFVRPAPGPDDSNWARTNRSRSLGCPAIVPYLNTWNPELPAFTADDAIACVLADPPTMGGPLVPLTEADIQVKFMRDSEADKLLYNMCIGLAPDAPVCVVQLHGSFPQTFRRHGYEPNASPFMFEVCDARTGNLLVMGGLKSALL